MAPNGTSSLLDLSLCSSDLLPKISYTVEADLWDSDHFPVQFALTRPYLRPRTHYRWASIIGEVNQALLSVDTIDYDSFLSVIQTSMIKHKNSTQESNKGCPAWWSTRCTNLRHHKRFYLKVHSGMLHFRTGFATRKSLQNYEVLLKQRREVFETRSARMRGIPDFCTTFSEKYEHEFKTFLTLICVSRDLRDHFSTR